MADGVTTRMQKEVTQLQKDMEKVNEKTEQLRVEFHTSIEAMGAEMRGMFEKVMIQMRSNNNNARVEDSGASKGVDSSEVRLKSVVATGNKSFRTTSTDNLDLTEPGRSQTKLSKLECPRFDGTDFKGWYLKMEQFFVVDHTRDQDRVRTVMMHLEGKALQWHQRFMKNQRSLSEVDWNQYMLEMRNRFSDNEFTDPMLEIVSLKQTTSVEEFYDEFESLLNLLNLPDDYALSIFVGNLKPDLSRPLRLFYPKTLTHALNLAKQLETMIFTTL